MTDNKCRDAIDNFPEPLIDNGKDVMFNDSDAFNFLNEYHKEVLRALKISDALEMGPSKGMHFEGLQVEKHSLDYLVRVYKAMIQQLLKEVRT